VPILPHLLFLFNYPFLFVHFSLESVELFALLEISVDHVLEEEFGLDLPDVI